MSTIDKFTQKTVFRPEQDCFYRLPPPVFSDDVAVFMGGVLQHKEDLTAYDRELLRGYQPDREPDEPVLTIVKDGDGYLWSLLKILMVPVLSTLLFPALRWVGVDLTVGPLLWVLSLCFIWVVTGLYALWFLQGYTQKHLASLYVYSVAEDAEVMERRRFLIGECARLSKEIEGLEHQRDKVLEVRKAELEALPISVVTVGSRVVSRDAAVADVVGEIGRVGADIEVLKGRLSGLQDSLAYSALAFLSSDEGSRRAYLAK